MLRNIGKRLDKIPFFIKLRSWEYWPMNLIYSPVYLYWIFLSLKARSFMFFTAANPGIPIGGLYGDSKMDILKMMPQELIPRTSFLKGGSGLPDAKDALAKSGIEFPLIAKPDVGERGFKVEKIPNMEALERYLQDTHLDLLLQEYIRYTEEVSVLYYRFPDEAEGHISSLTLKEFLSVTGDGIANVRQLMERIPRAVLQIPTFEVKHPDLMGQVPKAGEQIELVSIGNHCRGTSFLNGNPLIDKELIQVFDRISHQLDGIYFGRFDIRCKSIEDLKAGRHFRILELNGVKSEPTHIYQPGFSLREAYRVLFKQWKTIYDISMVNRKKGISSMSLWKGYKLIMAHKRYKKMAESV